MLAFMLLPVAARVQHDQHEDHKAKCDENNYPGLTLPYLPDAARKLGPIHFFK